MLPALQLFDIKMRNLGFAFCQPQKKSLQKSLTPKKVTTKFQTQKKVLRSQISNPKKGFAHPRHLYTLVPPLGPDFTIVNLMIFSIS